MDLLRLSATSLEPQGSSASHPMLQPSAKPITRPDDDKTDKD